jgi:predicted transglutaminase-like cysteine proteinase
MRLKKTILMVASIGSLAAMPFCANASWSRMPRLLNTQVDRIQFFSPALAPMAHVQFCLRYSDECKVRSVFFRRGGIRLTNERRADIVKVNNTVNKAIQPYHNDGGLSEEAWIINPSKGDCNDYAVTKRHELLAKGWPSRTLLLAEVVTSWGEHHLILVVRTTSGDLVLDNMIAQPRIWSKAPYHYVRMQTPENPNLWAAVDTNLAEGPALEITDQSLLASVAQQTTN